MGWKDILKEEDVDKGLSWFMPKERTKEEQSKITQGKAGHYGTKLPECPVCASPIRAKFDGSGYECAKDPSHYNKTTAQIYEEAGNR